MDIGRRIRELRIRNGLTQEELADRCELTKGFISQVERDQTSPSIATLMDLLQCLGVTVGEFFREDEETQIVFGADDFFEKTDDGLRNTIRWIVPSAQKNRMEPILLTLLPGGSTEPDDPHEGEEFGYVLSGSVTIVVGSRVCRARKGESFCFSPDKPHYLSSKKGASVLWISSPPSF